MSARKIVGISQNTWCACVLVLESPGEHASADALALCPLPHVRLHARTSTLRARARATTPAPLQLMHGRGAHERCTEQLTAAALEGGVAQSVGSAAVIVSAPGGDSGVDMGLSGRQLEDRQHAQSQQRREKGGVWG